MDSPKDPPKIKVLQGKRSPELQQKSPPSIKRSCAMPTAVNTTSPDRKSPPVNTAVITPPKASAAASTTGDDATALCATKQTNTSTRSCQGGASYAANFVPPDAVDSPVAASKGKRAAAPGVNPSSPSSSSQRPPSKRSKSASSKKSPIKTLDLSSPIRVRDVFIELKGANEPIPGDLLSALKAILMVYTVPELSEFSVEKTRVEWPKGAKTIGVHKLAEFFYHELNCLHEAGGHSLPIEWPPVNSAPTSKSDSVNEDHAKCDSRASNKTEGITLT